MRWTVFLVAVMLSGCSSSDQTNGDVEDPDEPTGPGDDEDGDVSNPSQPVQANGTAQVVGWINGTFENVGQCAVYPQAELDRIDWYDLPDGSAGAAYETEVEATVGPPPATVGQTGVCLYFHSGEDGPLGHQAGRTQAGRGDIPDGATQVAVLTDAAVGGEFTIKITIEQGAGATGAA